MKEELQAALSACYKAYWSEPRDTPGVIAALKKADTAIRGGAEISSDSDVTWGLFTFAVDLDEPCAQEGNKVAALIVKNGLDLKAKHQGKTPLEHAKEAKNAVISGFIVDVLAAKHRASDSPIIAQKGAQAPPPTAHSRPIL